MPYVLPATFDTLPRALRISPAERAANSSSAPLPGVPRRARTHLPANVRGGFTYGTPSQNEHGPSTSAASSSPGSLTPTPADMLALASPTTALLHVSQSTPLPCLALPRARRVRREADVVFPCAEPDASANAYVLAPPEPKHQPINGKNGLRLSLDAIKATLAGNTEPRPKPTTTATTPTPSLRKKSGELVKPSLKHAHTLSGGLPTQKSMSMSRSMPTTPTTPKFVHFDAQLEHVRLFLAEQKPTAVSRDGSPTETSEGEGNEFPWNGRGYGSSDDERAKKSLRVKSTNVPPCSSLDGSDVRVQSLTLSEDGSSLVGRVLVRNLAFEKWVAARFTFDLWQTTSEVSARYIDTVADGVDRFGFTIKLGDVMHRIEEKTLFVAVRYTVAGREIWDSNHGQNYMVSFTKQANSNGWSTKSRTRDQMSDLRKSLERAIQDDDDSVPQLQIKSRPRPSVRGMSFSGFEKPSVASIVGKQEPKPAKFGARYDFGAAPRERPSADAFRMPELKRPEPKPAKRPAVSTEVPRPIAKLCESPRDAEDMVGLRMVEPLVRSNGLELPSPADPVPIPRRHHHRASYFDAWTFPAPGVKRTASGPAVEDESKDMGIPASWMAGADMGADLFGGSVASTPSVTSASSPSQSPSSPPEFLPSPEIIDAEIDLGCGPKAVEPHNPNMNYSSFLDQFCFFTGPRPADNFTRPSDDYMYGGYSDATARTLRAVSSSLSNCSSDASASNTPRAGSPAHLARAGSPASSDSAH